MMEPVYIPTEEVLKRYKTSKMTLWRWARLRGFPRPIKFAGTHHARCFWLESELDAFDERRKAERAA